MEDTESIMAKETCIVCGNVGLLDGDDGFYYCRICGCQAQDVVVTAIPDEDFVSLYSARHSRRISAVKPEPPSQMQIPKCKSLYEALSEGIDAPVKPKCSDSANGFSSKDCCDNVRMSYVYGLQLMINLQCEALVEKFNVNPIICGISGTIWLRFLKSTGVFDDKWAHEIQLSQSDIHGDNLKQKMVLVWYKALRKRIPLSCTLAITYLCCHVAREAVLSTDIQRWSLEGNLPYLVAFVEIEKIFKSTGECPLTADYMFKPSNIVPTYKLISLAAEIAQSIGLKLPPVNFFGIAARYLKNLSLPVEKILPDACRIHEWSVPPGLWLSTSETTLPPRVFVMAILIVAIRILYNLNGLGKWEASLSTECHASANDISSVHKFEHEASHILRILQNKCADMSEGYDYSKDLPTYLRYCKDVVFRGSKPSSEDLLEEKTIKKLWELYLNSLKDCEACACSSKSQNVNLSEESRERGLSWMKQHMEENRFCYIPPRKKKKSDEYVEYARKREDGMLMYAVHADYYILLYPCARQAQVDPRIMHQAVITLEKRLSQIEHRIDAIFS